MDDGDEMERRITAAAMQDPEQYLWVTLAEVTALRDQSVKEGADTKAEFWGVVCAAVAEALQRPPWPVRS